MNGDHSAGIALNRAGNDGWASVAEDPDGAVLIAISGTAETLSRVTIRVEPPQGVTMSISITSPAVPGEQEVTP